jgi:hypothetical protein
LSQDKKSESLFSLLYWPPIKPAPPSAPKHQMSQPLNREMKWTNQGRMGQTISWGTHNSSHFNSLINMVKCIGLPCAKDFLLITTLAYTDQNRTIQKEPIVQLNDCFEQM